MKIIRPDNLKEFSLCVNVIDTHLSEWKNGDRFDKFRKLRRPFSALFFILSDLESVYREIDENGTEIRKIHCQKGDILYIPENTQYHAFFTAKGEMKNTGTCTINFDLTDLFGEHVYLDDHIVLLNHKVDRFMMDNLLNIHKCSRNPIDHNKLRITSIFFSILYYATRSLEGNKNPAIKTATHAIENEYNLNEKMEKYAHVCNMSLTNFYQTFKAYIGMSPTKYRNHIRINTAKSDIHNTNMTIREIALKAGFEDEFYFSKLFKKITGMSPKEFKNR